LMWMAARWYPFGRRLENRYLGWTKKIFYGDLQFTYLRTLRFKVMQIKYEIILWASSQQSSFSTYLQ
jgi:hypothetical protein